MATISSGTSLLDTGRALAPLVRQHSEYADANGRLAPEVVDAFLEAGMFGMWVPRELGGSELDPLSSLELNELIAYEDASTGWVLFTASTGIGAPAAYLPSTATDQIFAGGRLPAGAGNGSTIGNAVRVDGGYRLTGSWPFASSAPYASYILTLAMIEGTNDALILTLPVEDVTLDEDSWRDVIGLRGTGSFDYRIDDVFVPEEFTYSADLDENPVRGGALCRLGLVQTSMIGHTGWALGAARRLLDELVESVHEKAGRAGAQAGSDSFHEQYANAEAQLRSARALCYEAWTDVWETLCRGDDLSRRQGTVLRLALNNATWTAHRVGSFVFKAAGASALRPCTIQRFYRDVQAGKQHILSAPPILRSVGRELAGLVEGEHWHWMYLADDAA